MSQPSHRSFPRSLAGLALLAVLAGACSEATTSADATQPPSTPEATESPSASETPEATEEPTEPETQAAELPEAPEIVRGVYSTVYSFWGERWARLIDLVETTELNAIVIDVKDEAGTLLWPIDHPLTDAGGGAEWKPNGDPAERLQMLIDAGGYAIARVACFKDTLVAQARPDLAVQDNRTGGAWKARKDFSWLNPYQDEAGQWCIDVGLAAIEAGFHEVQFDYIRFPNGGDGDTSVIQLPGVPDDRPREQWRHTDEITDFLARASEQIHDAGGLVSADLFGLVTYDFTWDAQGTGQVMEQIAEHVDFISPMVYPSHYGVGNYGLMPHPIEHPYETVWNSMQEAQMRVQGLRAQIRPWLEDFSAPWMGYPNHTAQHVQKQIQATYDNGIEGWLLWNAGNSYTESILEKGEAVSKADPDFVPPYRTANPDAPPGVEDEKVWPGMPPCKPDRERLEIGRGNLAGSTPPNRAPGGDEEIACKPEPEETSSPGPSTTGSSEPAAEPSSSESEAAAG